LKKLWSEKFHGSGGAFYGALVIIGVFCHCSLFAEKILSYDEEKGIVFIDKDAVAQAKKPNPGAVKQSSPRPTPPIISHEPGGKLIDASIQRGRPKDPPEVYFESGLQYFKNKNFDDALRNFTHAESLDPLPKYTLWMGKTLRQLNHSDKLLYLMNKIVKTFPESDVADDALFEIAFYNQTNCNYDMAIKAYTQLAEQYPFGTSFSNGENFREIAHKQCQAMRSEIITTLNVLGFKGEEIETLISAFQKRKGLTPTGIGNAVTITAMKTAYDDFLKSEATNAQRIERLSKYRFAAIIACGILFLNCIFILICKFKIEAQRKLLATLQQTLIELSTEAL
jgi:tetratricopeptide (TPR) repeat protein